MLRKLESSKPQLSQVFIQSSDDDDDESERPSTDGRDSVSARGISRQLANLKGQSQKEAQGNTVTGVSPAKKAGQGKPFSLSDNESESEVEASDEDVAENVSSASEASAAKRKPSPDKARPQQTQHSVNSHSEYTTDSDSESQTSSNLAKPFKPPQDFTKFYHHSLLPDEVKDAFANVRGKQIFHITMPSSLPVSAIKQIDFSALERGASTTRYQNKTYHLSESKLSGKGLELLFPSSSREGKFTRAPRHIKKRYVLSQVTEKEDDSFHSFLNGTWALDTSLMQPRRVRNQPDRLLRYKYTPFGVPPTPSITDLVSDQDQSAIATLHHKTPPNASTATSKGKTRKRSQQKLKSKHSPSANEIQQGNSKATDDAALKKSVKKRKTDSQDDTLAIRTPSKKQESSQITKEHTEKKKKKKRKEIQYEGP